MEEDKRPITKSDSLQWMIHQAHRTQLVSIHVFLPDRESTDKGPGLARPESLLDSLRHSTEFLRHQAMGKVIAFQGKVSVTTKWILLFYSSEMCGAAGVGGGGVGAGQLLAEIEHELWGSVHWASGSFISHSVTAQSPPCNVSKIYFSFLLTKKHSAVFFLLKNLCTHVHPMNHMSWFHML